MVKFFMLTDLIVRNVPIDFGRNWIVGEAFISENRNMVFVQ